MLLLTTRGAELFTNLKLGKWTLWELEEYISYKSAYTMEFFRRIRQYSCRDTAKGKYWWEVSFEEFKELMGVPKRQSSGYIKEKVLAPILKELEDKYQLEIITLAPKKKMVDQQLLVISFILSMNHIVSTKLSKWKKNTQRI